MIVITAGETMLLTVVRILVFLLALLTTMLPAMTEKTKPISYQVFQQDGDVVLGGLFPIHADLADMGNVWKPEPLTCINFNHAGLIQALAMRFAVEEINNSSAILDGRILGYEIYDSCMQPRVIMHTAMLFITELRTRGIRALCNLTAYSSRIMAVIGPASSNVAMPTAKLFSSYLIPQISYGVTSAKFSDKSSFPSFLRTVPSDEIQVVGMLELISHFQWNWVAALASDDEYGRSAVSQLSTLASPKNICIAYEGLMPTQLTSKQTAKIIRDIVLQVHQKQVNVILVFAPAPMAKMLFQEVIKLNLTKVWIASSTWVLSEMILCLPWIKEIGPVIGFSHRGGTVPGFHGYLVEAISEMKQCIMSSGSANNTSTVSSEGYDGEGNIAISDINIGDVSLRRMGQYAYSVYSAVYSAAHALHEILDCNTGKCREVDSKTYPWQLLQAVKKVNFSILNTSFYFDSNGNPNVGYDIVTHSADEMGFLKIGKYNGKLVINDSLVDWQTKDKQVPASSCSSSCVRGQAKRVKGFHSCCFDCVACLAGTFQNLKDDFQCDPCPVGQWSSKGSTYCTQPTFLFQEWSHAPIIVLVFFFAVLLVLIAAIAVLFFRHRHMPVVQAAGGSMSFLTLFTLLVACCNPVVFVGRPTDAMCRVQQPLLSFIFTTILSTFLVKSLQVALVADFKKAPRTVLALLKPKGTWVMLTVIIFLGGLFCVWHMCTFVPLSTVHREVNFLSKYVECGIEPLISWVFMFGYNGLLALFSFMCCCVSQKPLKQYNLARDITFSMLGYLALWIVFIPVYFKVEVEKNSLLQMTITLATIVAIVGCYFLPKCYILLFRSDLDTVEYFKIYLQ